MRYLVLVVLALGVLGASAAVAEDSSAIEKLKHEDPFLVVECLTQFSYEELTKMYPALSDTDLKTLRLKIVDYMKSPEAAKASNATPDSCN